MRFTVYDHCAGLEAAPAEVRAEIEAVITALQVPVEKGSAPRIRDAFLQSVLERGWSGEVQVAQGSGMTITSVKQGVGLCLQMGNMARMYADLMKLQTLYLDNAIRSAIFVLPSQPVALAVGSNIAQASRLERELPIFRKAHYVPTLVYALE